MKINREKKKRTFVGCELWLCSYSFECLGTRLISFTSVRDVQGAMTHCFRVFDIFQQANSGNGLHLKVTRQISNIRTQAHYGEKNKKRHEA